MAHKKAFGLLTNRKAKTVKAFQITVLFPVAGLRSVTVQNSNKQTAIKMALTAFNVNEVGKMTVTPIQ